MNKIYFLLILLSQTLFSQNINLSENSKISLLTCGSGHQELYMTFGHTGIRVQDPEKQIDVVFNYGNFDFNEGNFYLKFIKGDLQYFVSVIPFRDFIAEYQMQNRDVLEQVLDLNLTQKQKVFDIVNKSLLPENRYYTYKFINRNCTTLAKEKLEKALGITITKTDNSNKTYREILYPYFDDFFYFKLGINIIFGEKTDEKATKLFLPIELEQSVSKIQIQNKPLLQSAKKIVNSIAEPKKPFSFFNSLYFLSSILLLILIINNKMINNIVLVIFGLLGTFLSLVSLYSLHEEVLWNYNTLLFNPLLIIYPFISNNKKIKLYLLISFCLLIYIGIMISKPFILLMLPFIIFIAILVYRTRKIYL